MRELERPEYSDKELLRMAFFMLREARAEQAPDNRWLDNNLTLAVIAHRVEEEI